MAEDSRNSEPLRRGDPVTIDQAVLQGILDTAVDAIITIDVRGTVLSFNRAGEKIFGYRAEEVIGRDVSMLMPEPYRSQHGEYVTRYLTTGEKRIIGRGREVRGCRKDGTIFPMNLGVSEVISGSQRVFTGIVEDITERRSLEEAREALIAQLESANAELERFTYTVSHDLKSPLITIKGFLGMIVQDAEEGKVDRLRGDVARIEAAADKMTQLLDELLELSRIGRVANPAEDIPFGALVGEVLTLLHARITQRDVKIDLASDLPIIRGDRVRLREVVQNLVENAIKFTPETTRPHIRIFGRDDGERFVFTVSDNGQGIESRHRERIFRLFERLEGSAGGGTGVGLALVKRILEIHGGEIWVESPGLGQGSEFHFTLAKTQHFPAPSAGDQR